MNQLILNSNTKFDLFEKNTVVRAVSTITLSEEAGEVLGQALSSFEQDYEGGRHYNMLDEADLIGDVIGDDRRIIFAKSPKTEIFTRKILLKINYSFFYRSKIRSFGKESLAYVKKDFEKKLGALRNYIEAAIN